MTATPAAKGSVRKTVAWSLLGLLLLLLLLGAGLATLLGTERGSRWVLEQVPGLQVDNFSGQLGGHWRADRLQWQQAQDRVELQAPQLAWSPACLLRLTLCVQRLEVERVTLVFAPGSDQPDSALSLPDIQLPLALQLDELRIGSLLLNGSEQLRDLHLAANWTEQGLRINHLRLQRDELSLDLQGQLQPQGAWPLELDGTLKLPAPEQQPWALALRIQGELLDSLQVTGESSGYLAAQLDGQLQPLAEHLPATLRLRAEAFQASSALPDTLRLEQVELTATGDLAAGYQLLGRARLPGEGGAVDLDLQGRVDSEGADIAALKLTASPEQRLTLSGQLDWRETLSAEARFDWLDFPWRRLYPDVAEPAVALRRLTGEVYYQDGNYLGHFAAALDGPAGEFSLSSPVSGDLSQLHLPDLQLQAGKGTANGQLTLGFADGISWNTALQLSALDPAYWLAELPGSLAGPLRSQGRFQNEQLSLSAELDLKGQLRGQPAQLTAQANGEGENWSLSGLELRLGANRIQGQARLGQRLDGQLQLTLPRLAQLWPQLQGRLEGRLDLAGTLEAPQGQLKLQGRDLAMAEQRLASLTLDARLDAAQRGRLSLNGAGLRLGDTLLGTVQASAAGDRQRQQLELSLQGPRLTLSMALDGLLEQGAWRGRLSRGRVQAGGQDWRLQQPAPLERLASGRVQLGSHCWRSGPASLCGEANPLFPEPSLNYRLQNFPLDSLAQWLPQDFAWQGQLNGEVRLELPAAGPNGRIRLDAGSGLLRIRDDQQWLDFPYDRLTLDSTLSPQRIDNQLVFSGPTLGELRVQAQIDPRPASKPLRGEFSLTGLDLAVARPFVPMVETLAGQLNGRGTLSGGLLAPRVNGQLTLSNGQIAGSELPTSIENLQLRALIAGERVELRGNWRSGEQGRGDISGELRWAEGLSADLRLRGTRLPLAIEPFAQLEVEPDLQLSLSGEQLAIAGTVSVPRGQIEIRQLPPSTVKLSRDAVIVGAQTEPTQAAREIAMDITLEVGQDRLSFKGFGLTADVRGRLQIGDNLDSRGELNLINGRYRAYGQRLTLRRARLLFAGPLDQPFLDIEATRRVGDVVAGLRLTGNAEQPTSVVFSEPAMSQEQALSYLVLGRPLASDGGESNILGQAALALGLAGSSGVAMGLAQRLGIGDFQLDTYGSGPTTNVVASGQLSERLSLRYGVGVFESANILALRYRLSKRVYLEAASGLASSLDIFYKRDF